MKRLALCMILVYNSWLHLDQEQLQQAAPNAKKLSSQSALSGMTVQYVSLLHCITLTVTHDSQWHMTHTHTHTHTHSDTWLTVTLTVTHDSQWHMTHSDTWLTVTHGVLCQLGSIELELHLTHNPNSISILLVSRNQYSLSLCSCFIYFNVMFKVLNYVRLCIHQH